MTTKLPAHMHKLLAAQEEDEAQAAAWVKAADGADIPRTWQMIQRLGGTNELELISRFAQLGMSHAVLLAEKER